MEGPRAGSFGFFRTSHLGSSTGLHPPSVLSSPGKELPDVTSFLETYTVLLARGKKEGKGRPGLCQTNQAMWLGSSLKPPGWRQHER